MLCSYVIIYEDIDQSPYTQHHYEIEYINDQVMFYSHLHVLLSPIQNFMYCMMTLIGNMHYIS